MTHEGAIQNPTGIQAVTYALATASETASRIISQNHADRTALLLAVREARAAVEMRKELTSKESKIVNFVLYATKTNPEVRKQLSLQFRSNFALS